MQTENAPAIIAKLAALTFPPLTNDLELSGEKPWKYREYFTGEMFHVAREKDPPVLVEGGDTIPAECNPMIGEELVFPLVSRSGRLPAAVPLIVDDLDRQIKEAGVEKLVFAFSMTVLVEDNNQIVPVPCGHYVGLKLTREAQECLEAARATTLPRI